jgi:hypothetical protein
MNTSLLVDKNQVEATPMAAPYIGAVMALGDSGDLVEDIIAGLQCMKARADVALSDDDIGRLLLARQLRNPNADIPADPMLLHTHSERLCGGALVTCDLLFDQIGSCAALWWQVAMMTGPGGHATRFWSSSQTARDTILDLLRCAAGGRSSELREISPSIPSNAEIAILLEAETNGPPCRQTNRGTEPDGAEDTTP